MISIKNLSKNFRDLEVLDNITFNINKDSFVSIIGPSGCGKTVLMKIIAGLDSPSSGKIRLEKDINPVIVWQDFRLFR